uniref:Aldehyde dehydrogenase domain-containing protein n=1 Tax=Timema monikensis TaxID=170555 RepID=A0A7R9E9F1_9NEOP|nr:unnamed protein product [Timema monikensis]
MLAGLLEYLQREGTPQSAKLATIDYTQFGNSADTSASVPSSLTPTQMSASPIVDCTYKLYYGGTHKRPDGNASRTVYNARNQPLALVPEGGKKDVRNAVEAAIKAQPAWWRGGAHLRAQIIYNMAEKLQARRLDFTRHLQTVWNCDTQSADSEVDRSLQLLFYWAASCDKPSLGGDNRDMSAMVFQEPLGVLALLVCEGATGLGLESLLRHVVPAVSNGNTVVVVPDPEHPTIALELCQVIDTCDLPSGVVNVLTGDINILSSALVSHQEVRGVWYSEGSPELGSYLHWESAHNLKRVWQVPSGQLCREQAEYHATQIKAVWVPGGQIFAN